MSLPIVSIARGEDKFALLEQVAQQVGSSLLDCGCELA